MNPGYIYARYRISINGSYANEHRKDPLNQAQIDNFDFQVGTIFEQVLKRKTGQIIVEGIHYSGWAIVVMPYLAPVCNSQTFGRTRRNLVEGHGFNAGVQFKLDWSCAVDPKNKDFKPGGSPAEALFHELVHAFRYVTGKADPDRKGPLNPYLPNIIKNYPEYDEVEDFFAILVTNIFASETGRPLRANHSDFTLLPSHLSTNKGFLAVQEYAKLVREFCSDHRSVSQQIRDVPSPFNPIKEVLIGQGYQYLLNDE